MSDFGYDLSTYRNDIDKCTTILSNYLNKGKLGLYLGAGTSVAIGLPNWTELVNRCISDLPDGLVTIDKSKPFDTKYYSTKFKKECPDDKYREIVGKNLYRDVVFDFQGLKKEILIALTSLMVGKVRGNVSQIITLNFDDVLEWYLETNGLRVSQVGNKPLDSLPSDVEVLHLHGFLPFHTDVWDSSEEIVFTEEEFEQRERGKSSIKSIIEEFYKSHIFLGIGLSSSTVAKDIAPYTKVLLNDWYKREGLERGYPFGFVFLTSCEEEQAEKLLDSGIVPCVISDINEIPAAIFSIAQKGSKVRKRK